MTAANSLFALINEAVRKNKNREKDQSHAMWRLTRDYYLKPFPILFPLVTALSSLRGLNLVVYPFCLAWIESWIVSAEVSLEEKYIRAFILGGGMITMELGRFVLSVWTGNMTILFGQKMVYRMRHRVNDKLHRMDMAYHHSHAPGRLLTHLFSDLQNMMSFMTSWSRFGVSITVSLLVGMPILLYQDWLLGLIALLAMPLLLTTYATFRKKLRAVNEAMRSAEGALNGLIGDRVPAFEVVKAFGKETREALSYARGAKPVMRYGVAATVLGGLVNSVTAAVGALMIAIVVWITVERTREGTMDADDVIYFYSAIGLLFQPMQWITHLIVQFYPFQVAVNRVYKIIDAPDSAQIQHHGNAEAPMKPSALSFRNVKFTYPETEDAVLKDLTFELPLGKRLCVMGASGAGKSTLARLVMRLYDPDEGSIKLGEHDLRDYKLESLREAVGYAAQEATIFAGTVAGNIAYQPEPASFDQVVTGATQAQIHQDIEALPSSYHTLTQERGFTLSGGQKQRVNLARAFAADRPILIIDDTTSALDADTEAALIETLHMALSERTAMIISHRVSVAMACDYVLMLEDGKAAEFGDPRELKLKGGAFAELFDLQRSLITGE